LSAATVVFAMAVTASVRAGARVVAATDDAFARACAQSGKDESSGYTTAPQVGNVTQTTIKVKIDGPIPAIAISLVRILATPATMAFGGVPTYKNRLNLVN